MTETKLCLRHPMWVIYCLSFLSGFLASSSSEEVLPGWKRRKEEWKESGKESKLRRWKGGEKKRVRQKEEDFFSVLFCSERTNIITIILLPLSFFPPSSSFFSISNDDHTNVYLRWMTAGEEEEEKYQRNVLLSFDLNHVRDFRCFTWSRRHKWRETDSETLYPVLYSDSFPLWKEERTVLLLSPPLPADFVSVLNLNFRPTIEIGFIFTLFSLIFFFVLSFAHHLCSCFLLYFWVSCSFFPFLSFPVSSLLGNKNGS